MPTPSFATQGSEELIALPDTVNEDLSFEHIGPEEGLSNDYVTSILQDEAGFLWVGTFDGLSRWDGYEFTVFNYQADDPTSLSGDVVWRLLEAQDGSIWVATQGAGISRFDPASETFTRFRHRETDPASLAADFVQAIIEDKAGNIWAGTLSGLDRYDPQSGGFRHYRNDYDSPDVTFGSNLIESLAEDRNGLIWMTTRNGLFSFDPQAETYTRHVVDPGVPESDTALTLFFDDEGLLWISTLAGVYVIDPKTFETIRMVPDPANLGESTPALVRTFYQDLDGAIWLGGENGLARWDPVAEQFSAHQNDPDDPASLSNSNAYTVMRDASGLLWVGTAGGGLNRSDPWHQKFQLISSEEGEGGLAGSEVWAFCEDRFGNLWVGTSAGLNRWNRESGEWALWEAREEDPPGWLEGAVWVIRPDHDQNLWIATDAGLTLFDPGSGRALLLVEQGAYDPHGPEGSDVTDILIDSRGDLWFGHSGLGLSRRDRETGELTHLRYARGDQSAETLEENLIWDLQEDRNVPGLIWVGTHSGLARFQNQEFSFYPHDLDDPAGASENPVSGIYQDDEGLLWLATDGSLDVFDPLTGEFRHYYVRDGLPDNTLHDILPDEYGRLWISTNRGLTRFDPAEGSFHNYGLDDGLQDLAFHSGAAYVTSGGELLFGGPHGFNIIEPTSVSDNVIPPKVAITDMRISNRSLGFGPGEVLEQPIYRTRAVTLSPEDTALTFELAALHYASPEDNQYAYIMEGFDREWNVLENRRFATYTNLPPGSYTFRAIASNGDGAWNMEGASLAITIPRPFWQTTWFLTMVAIALAGAAVGSYRLRMQQIAARHAELEGLVTERTRELSSLYTITAVVSSSLDLEETLSAALDKTLELMGNESGGIHLLDKRRNHLHLATHRGLDKGCVQAFESLPRRGSLLEPAILASRPHLVSDLGQIPEQWGAPLCAAGFEWMAVTPLVSRGEVLGTLFMAAHADHDFSDLNLELLGSIGNQIGVAIENASFFADMKLRADQFRLINEVGRRFTVLRKEFDLVLAQVVQMIQQTFGYYHVAISMVEGEEVVYRVGAGRLWEDPDFDFRPARLKVGKEGLTGWVAGTGQTLIVPDVSADPRYVWMKDSETKSELLVPLIAGEQVMGVLDVQSDRLDDFDETDLAVMQLLAGQASTAIQNAALYEQAQQYAVVQERNRLARDLHDAVTQTLFSASLIAEAMPELWRADPEEGMGLLDELRQLTRGALAEMRTLLLELRPESLAEARLSDLLTQLAAATMGRAHIPVGIRVEEPADLPGSVRVALYRIAQEALNNVVKHAQASEVGLRLASVPGKRGVVLWVRDNGRGFDPDEVPPYHLGLGIIRERAQSIGAELQLESQIGSGTEICVTWHPES